MSEFKPLHTTLSEASEGDCGCLCYDGEWRLGREGLSDNLKVEMLYVDLLLGEKAEWYEIEALASLPWMPISAPPYDGDEKPCTHAVTIQDRRGTCIISWSMNETDGKKSVQRVSDYIHAMLQENPA